VAGGHFGAVSHVEWEPGGKHLALLLLYHCLTAAALLQVVAAGHFGAVSDVEWEPGGKYLVSVSKDQTARLWAEWTQGASAVNQ
jgi:WD40 repeat protein